MTNVRIEINTIPTEPPPQPAPPLAILLHDIELMGQSRLADPSYPWHNKVSCVPEINEYGPDLVDPIGEYRVDITPIWLELYRLNNYDNNPDMANKRMKYYGDAQSCFFNGGNKFPRHQQVAHSGNVVEVLGETTIAGVQLALRNARQAVRNRSVHHLRTAIQAITAGGVEFTKFKTVIPGVTDVSKMAHESHPQFVHHWELTCWTKEAGSWQRDTIYDKGVMFYLLVSREGYAYIQSRYVRRLAP